MNAALTIMLFSAFAMLFACVVVVLQFVRYRSKGLGMLLLCPLGLCMTFGLFSAVVGVSEGAWTARSPGLWIAVAIGAAGVLLTALGWRAVLRRPKRPGQHPGCGHELAGLPSCPECGEGTAQPRD